MKTYFAEKNSMKDHVFMSDKIPRDDANGHTVMNATSGQTKLEVLIIYTGKRKNCRLLSFTWVAD